VAVQVERVTGHAGLDQLLVNLEHVHSGGPAVGESKHYCHGE
jgi:hypothetical protein